MLKGKINDYETCIQEPTQQGHGYSMQVTYDQIVK